jgi:hypothetical protein
MTEFRDIDEARNTVLQKIGRNVVNYQKMEAMLKYLLGFSQMHGPVGELQSTIAERIKSFAKMPMGPLVEKVASNLFVDSIPPVSPTNLKGEAWLTFGVSMEGGEQQAQMWSAAMMSVVEQRNRLIHQMVARFDPRSMQSCESMCAE